MNGLARERQVAGLFRERGFLVASLRHTAGAGDLLALEPAGQFPGLGLEGHEGRGFVVEVKATQRPYERFGPILRANLAEQAQRYDLTPMLVHWPANAEPDLITADRWPLVAGFDRPTTWTPAVIEGGADG